jgi:hypothetical protein
VHIYRAACALNSDGVETWFMEPADILKVLAQALAPYVADSLGRSEDSSDWVDVAAALPTLKRVLWRACRRGELPGRRVKRRWLARRADLDAWIEAHETGMKAPSPVERPEPRLPPPQRKPPPEPKLTPAQEHEKEMDAFRARFGLRRLTDSERAARRMPPYDVDREYAEHLAAEARRAEERAARERDDNDPVIAKQRAEATRAADAAPTRRPYKGPRATCERCRRQVAQRRDGRPVAHGCPHQFGYHCYDEEGNSEGAVPHCPWCRQERGPS